MNNQLNRLKNEAEQAGQVWTEIVTSHQPLFYLNLGEIWRYRDLLFLFVRRDFRTTYNQTILGPVWHLLHPLATTLVFVLVFGRMAGISTNGAPHHLFYLLGVTNWTYFATCLVRTSTTFTSNAHIFGKVYFPRLILPISVAFSGFLNYLIQSVLFICALVFALGSGAGFTLHYSLLYLVPVVFLVQAMLGLGLGITVASFSTRYRDLTHLLSFGVQLLMYCSPVIFPLSAVPERYRFLEGLNPMTGVLETLRYVFLDAGTFSPWLLLYSLMVSAGVLLGGLILFRRSERLVLDYV